MFWVKYWNISHHLCWRRWSEIWKGWKNKKTIEYENNFFPLEELGPNDEIVDGDLCSENIYIYRLLSSLLLLLKSNWCITHSDTHVSHANCHQIMYHSLQCFLLSNLCLSSPVPIPVFRLLDLNEQLYLLYFCLFVCVFLRFTCSHPSLPSLWEAAEVCSEWHCSSRSIQPSGPEIHSLIFF